MKTQGSVASLAVIAIAVFVAIAKSAVVNGIPREPVVIGHEPQFVFDLYVVDNHWGLNFERETVKRIFHQPKKHPNNPLKGFTEDASWHWVLRDQETGLFKMWYQIHVAKTVEARGAEIKMKWAKEDAERKAKGLPPLPAEGRRIGVARYLRGIGYAESKDGINWTRPSLNFVKWPEMPGNNNALFRTANLPQILENIPDKDRRGFKYIMVYLADGVYLIGSHDGIHWDESSRMRIARLASDHPNYIVYDKNLDEYVMFCRAKHLYHPGTEPEPSRRVSRMTSKELWTDWMANMEPQTIIDEMDFTDNGFNYSMAMPVRHYAGIYWGFLEPFRYNDYCWTELVVSRDSLNFQRMPGRPKFLEYGPDGSWDDTIIMTSASWVEVGDEWWFYYNGWSGPHGKLGLRDGAASGHYGVATIRKEGLISMRGPAGGGMIVTRKIQWPGGGLLVNANAKDGELKVAITDEKRRPIAGFGRAESQVFTSDSVATEIKWNGRSLDELKGKVFRLEFFLKNADLYTFRADDGKRTASPSSSVIGK